MLELHFPIFRSCHDAFLTEYKALNIKDDLSLFHLFVCFTDNNNNNLKFGAGGQAVEFLHFNKWRTEWETICEQTDDITKIVLNVCRLCSQWPRHHDVF